MLKNVIKHRRLVDDFRHRLSYLNQATQYMTSDEMKGEVDEAIKQIADIVASMHDDAKVNAYRAKLDSLMGKYADWYLAEYNRLHISNIENAAKQRIMLSPENKICEIIFRADHNKGYFSQSVHYSSWLKRMGDLQERHSSVTRDAVLRTPYMGFNPMQYKGKQLPKLSDLSDDLKDIFGTDTNPCV